MFCIKKQLGTIFAVSAPAALALAGLWDSSHLADPAFVSIGSWLACMFGFVAIIMMSGAQRRHDLPSLHCFAAAMTVTLLALGAAILSRKASEVSGASDLEMALWRIGFVVAITGMVVSTFAGVQAAWRYANIRFPDLPATFAGLLKFPSFR